MLLLVPLAVAGAMQPILIGQAISLIRQEPNTYEFLKDRSLSEGLNILEGLLLLLVVVRLVFVGTQGYLVQKVGQKSPLIRNDLFDHVISGSALLTRRTPIDYRLRVSDVSAGDVFTRAIGIISDLFSMLVIVIAMFSLQWQLALILVLMLFPVTGLVFISSSSTAKRITKLGKNSLLSTQRCKENIVGINVVQLFRQGAIQCPAVSLH